MIYINARGSRAESHGRVEPPTRVEERGLPLNPDIRVTASWPDGAGQIVRDALD